MAALFGTQRKPRPAGSAAERQSSGCPACGGSCTIPGMQPTGAVPGVTAGKAICCAVVFCRSPGMAIDAAALSGAIRSFRPDARIVNFELHPRFTKDYVTPAEIRADVRAQLPFDFVFLLEHAHSNPPFLDAAFAR